MTWGEIQLITLQKMFVLTESKNVGDLPNLKTDRKYVTYFDAMPSTANEGIRIMLNRGKPYRKMYKLSREYDKDLSDEKYYCFDLNEILDDYNHLTNVYKGSEEVGDYKLRINSYLYLPTYLFKNGGVSIVYEAYPNAITTRTLSTTKIDLPIEMLNILPLYIVSELYKDDDIALATVYRNEFETELENMKDDNNYEGFQSTSGWL